MIDFSSANDHVLDDLIDMKRLKVLPFQAEVKTMLNYFLDHCRVAS
jgi:hypothetical protein